MASLATVIALYFNIDKFLSFFSFPREAISQRQKSMEVGCHVLYYKTCEQEILIFIYLFSFVMK